VVHVTRVGRTENLWNILINKGKGEGLLEKPRSRWENNIKNTVKLILFDRDGLTLSQDRVLWRVVMNTIMIIKVLQGPGATCIALLKKFTDLNNWCCQQIQVHLW
jgi:hypothetical protein